ncbi:hypothetical protein BDM02DRAFT_3107899 [Thelephora ganbajun]|uniref:Uncharacterized protein n=1 Tax=Thelephora ganbajun TaxID=370292 RepID=A0ACB6ZV79_THEGA|nr:hypothetical protein BDM02DRAFT_3107899 [Thelephora ganbajun]
MDREVNIDSIRALEEQIKEHERTIIKLKRARNSLLNVSTLPPEVLGKIFRWNVTLKDDFDGLEEGSHNFLLVCRHWFEVASRTPELWSFWGNNLGDWEERYLRSSVGTPLDLVLDGLTYMFGSVSESQQMVLKDYAARDTIRRVHLQSDMHCLLTSIIFPLLSSRGGLRTNSLESFILCNEDQTPLDVSFFAHSCLPKLRRLKLAGCIISSWDHLTPRTTLLTTLELFFDDVSPYPTMPQLLSILASNPHLQKLTLNPRAIPNDGGGGSSSHVPLRHLQELRLEGGVEQVFGLLRRLEHPEKMGMLTLDLLYCSVADISQTIGPYLRNYLWCRGRSRNGLGLCLSSSSYITFSVGDATRLHPSTLISSRMTSFVSLSVGMNQALPEDGLEKLTLDLIAHTPREEIVYFRTCSSLEAVKDLGVQLPNLKALDLYRVPLSAAFPVLGRDGFHVYERFPSLQHLLLARPHLNVDSWIPLIVFLSYRASSGNQLDSLLVDGPCHMCSTITQRIRGFVRKFKIDDECLRSWCPFGNCL